MDSLDPTRAPEPDGEPEAPEIHELEEGVPGYVLREDPSRPRGPLRHDRSLPLPLRVKSGSFQPDRLVVETAKEILEIPWVAVRLVALGLVEEKVETEATAYNLEKMMGGMSRLVRGSGGRDENRITSTRETYLLDLYVQGNPEPLRFDSSHLNYRAFLGQISYVSFQNFFRLVHGLASRATEARFSPALVHFLARRRDQVQRFPALYEFELDTQARLQALERQAAWSDLDLGRSTWAEEWAED